MSPRTSGLTGICSARDTPTTTCTDHSAPARRAGNRHAYGSTNASSSTPGCGCTESAAPGSPLCSCARCPGSASVPSPPTRVPVPRWRPDGRGSLPPILAHGQDDVPAPQRLTTGQLDVAQAREGANHRSARACLSESPERRACASRRARNGSGRQATSRFCRGRDFQPTRCRTAPASCRSPARESAKPTSRSVIDTRPSSSPGTPSWTG